MKKFVFRPQVLLEMQIRVVERLQGELSNISKKKRLEEEKLELMKADLADLAARKEATVKKGMPAGELHFYDDYRKSLESDILSQRVLIARLEKEFVAKQEELAKEHRRLKTLEKFREIRYTEYKHEKIKLENKLMDEIGVRGFIMQKEE